MAGPPRDLRIGKVGTQYIELAWAPGGGVGVRGYRVTGRAGGEGSCTTLIEDTGSAACWARVSVTSGSWWELRVAAITDGGVGAESKLTPPVMTKTKDEKAVRRGNRGSRRRRSRAVAAPSDERLSSGSDAEQAPMGEDNTRLEADYARVKAEMHT